MCIPKRREYSLTPETTALVPTELFRTIKAIIETLLIVGCIARGKFAIYDFIVK